MFFVEVRGFKTKFLNLCAHFFFLGKTLMFE